MQCHVGEQCTMPRLVLMRSEVSSWLGSVGDHSLFRQSNAIAGCCLVLGPILPASEEGEELVDGDLNEEDDNVEEDEEESAADSGEEDNEVEARAEAEEETSEPEGMEEQSLRGIQHSRGVVL